MSMERQRLQWRCRRGMLELDILLQEFLRHGYDELNEAEQHSFLQLLELPDQQLLDLLMEREPPKERDHVELIRRIRRIRHTAVD